MKGEDKMTMISQKDYTGLEVTGYPIQSGIWFASRVSDCMAFVLDRSDNRVRLCGIALDNKTIY